MKVLLDFVTGDFRYDASTDTLSVDIRAHVIRTPEEGEGGAAESLPIGTTQAVLPLPAEIRTKLNHLVNQYMRKHLGMECNDIPAPPGFFIKE